MIMTKKKTVKEKIEHKETLYNINVHILPTETKTVTCYKTDPSSYPVECPMTTKPQLSELQQKFSYDSRGAQCQD
jgi:hypothetical protein